MNYIGQDKYGFGNNNSAFLRILGTALILR